MVRGKIQMRRIEDDADRQVSFSKRGKGMLKKASELSLLCDVDVALILFSDRGKLSEYTSSSMHEMIERYRQCKTPVVQATQHMNLGTALLTEKIRLLEIGKRKLLGEDLGSSSSFDELDQVEQQLEKSVCAIRERKMKVYNEQMERLKEKGKTLEADNAILSAKCQPWQELNGDKECSPSIETENPDVDTELYIGLGKKM